MSIHFVLLKLKGYYVYTFPQVGDLKGDGAMGICRKTCGICEVCAGDRECYLRNRKRAGYLFIEELWPEGGKRASVHLPDK